MPWDGDGTYHNPPHAEGRMLDANATSTNVWARLYGSMHRCLERARTGLLAVSKSLNEMRPTRTLSLHFHALTDQATECDPVL